MSEPNRRTAILDAAERLFSEHGYDGVSMRMVATDAPVGLGLLTHHFTSKDALFEAVVARRADILNVARREALEALAATPALEDVLFAFIRPYRDLVDQGGTGWRAYARLVASLTQDPRWTDLVRRRLGELGPTYIARLRAAEPALDRDAAARAYVLLVSLTMAMFASTGLLDRFSDGRLSSEDFSPDAVERLVRFTAAGVRALV